MSDDGSPGSFSEIGSLESERSTRSFAKRLDRSRARNYSLIFPRFFPRGLRDQIDSNGRNAAVVARSISSPISYYTQRGQFCSAISFIYFSFFERGRFKEVRDNGSRFLSLLFIYQLNYSTLSAAKLYHERKKNDFPRFLIISFTSYPPCHERRIFHRWFEWSAESFGSITRLLSILSKIRVEQTCCKILFATTFILQIFLADATISEISYVLRSTHRQSR